MQTYLGRRDKAHANAKRIRIKRYIPSRMPTSVILDPLAHKALKTLKRRLKAEEGHEASERSIVAALIYGVTLLRPQECSSHSVVPRPRARRGVLLGPEPSRSAETAAFSRVAVPASDSRTATSSCGISGRRLMIRLEWSDRRHIVRRRQPTPTAARAARRSRLDSVEKIGTIEIYGVFRCG